MVRAAVLAGLLVLDHARDGERVVRASHVAARLAHLLLRNGHRMILVARAARDETRPQGRKGRQQIGEPRAPVNQGRSPRAILPSIRATTPGRSATVSTT